LDQEKSGNLGWGKEKRAKSLRQVFTISSSRGDNAATFSLDLKIRNSHFFGMTAFFCFIHATVRRSNKEPKTKFVSQFSFCAGTKIRQRQPHLEKNDEVKVAFENFWNAFAKKNFASKRVTWISATSDNLGSLGTRPLKLQSLESETTESMLGAVRLTMQRLWDRAGSGPGPPAWLFYIFTKSPNPILLKEIPVSQKARAQSVNPDPNPSPHYSGPSPHYSGPTQPYFWTKFHYRIKTEPG
jgi:hypothetical protein